MSYLSLSGDISKLLFCIVQI